MDAEIYWETELVVSEFPTAPARNNLLITETDSGRHDRHKVISYITDRGTNPRRVPPRVKL